MSSYRTQHTTIRSIEAHLTLRRDLPTHTTLGTLPYPTTTAAVKLLPLPFRLLFPIPCFECGVPAQRVGVCVCLLLLECRASSGMLVVVRDDVGGEGESAT